MTLVATDPELVRRIRWEPTPEGRQSLAFKEWLVTSKLRAEDALLVFSVGGGTETTSKNLVLAMQYAKEKDARIVSVVRIPPTRMTLVSTLARNACAQGRK